MKCEFCINEAIYRFSPDLDIVGFGACDEHKKDMQVGYILLMVEGEEAYNSFVRSKIRHAKLNKPESKAKLPEK